MLKPDNSKTDVEETIEMLAITILWFLFLRHLAVAASDLHVRFRKEM